MLSVFKIGILLFIVITITSCKTTGQVSKQGSKFLNDSLLQSPHAGICIYEPATGKYWYDHQSDKYFVPASNTKLFTLYAGLKYLGDSLPSARYEIFDNEVMIYPTGDPSFLHPDFKTQPLFIFLKAHPKFKIVTNSWQSKPWGTGWAWDDFNDDYMAERSILPMYGNITRITWKNDSLRFFPYNGFSFSPAISLPSEIAQNYNSILKKDLPAKFRIQRMISTNVFELVPSTYNFSPVSMPIRTDEFTVIKMLLDTLNEVNSSNISFTSFLKPDIKDNLPVIKSQPSDSLFLLMMHRSDNFFAEQTLLMAANEKFRVHDERRMIDSLLNFDLHDIPQRPNWVDGSGLSRYNLFTPKSFVWLLNKMQNEFGLDRLKVILPTGNEGTLKNLYQRDSGYIFAKTGTVSNNLALSGFLITKKNKLLIFSVMVNAYPGGATPIRRKIETFLTSIRTNH